MLVLLLITVLTPVVLGYSKGYNFTEAATCQDLKACVDPHGPGVDLDLGVLSFDIKHDDNDPSKYEIKVRLSGEIFFCGWAIQVREFGNSRLDNTSAHGVIANLDAYSTPWACPGFDGVIRENGVLHRDGQANNVAGLQEVKFDWFYLTANIPTCARVVATIMDCASGEWFHAKESECFLDRVVSQQCDSVLCGPSNYGGF